MCRYGRYCHTRTPENLAKYEHPEPETPSYMSSYYGGGSRIITGSTAAGAAAWRSAGSASSTAGAGSSAAGVAPALVCSTTASSDKSRPICRFGEGCYNTNPKHLAEFAHPWKEGETADEAK